MLVTNESKASLRSLSPNLEDMTQAQIAKTLAHKIIMRKKTALLESEDFQKLTKQA